MKLYANTTQKEIAKWEKTQNSLIAGAIAQNIYLTPNKAEREGQNEIQNNGKGFKRRLP